MCSLTVFEKSRRGGQRARDRNDGSVRASPKWNEGRKQSGLMD